MYEHDNKPISIMNIGDARRHLSSGDKDSAREDLFYAKVLSEELGTPLPAEYDSLREQAYAGNHSE